MTATASAATGPNLALGRPALASSLENSSYPARNAFDGKTSTRWSSSFNDPRWIYVDLGATYNVNEVVLNWETAYGKAYQVQVSADAAQWTTIYSTTTGTGGTNDLKGLSGTGRYVRMYGTTRGTPWGYSLWELAVYGTPAASSSPTTTQSPTAAPTGTTGTTATSTSGTTATSTSGTTTTGTTTTGTTTTSTGMVQPAGTIPGWWTKLVFDDEFSSPETWGNVWSQDRGGPSGQMNNVTTDPNNVSVSGGLLNLKLASSTDGAYVSTFASDGGGGFMMGYGYAEARIYLPQTNGQLTGWPAWWTVGTTWPADGEADIVEGLGGDATSNYHYSLNDTDQTNNSNTIPGNWGGGWHTFGLDREPGENYIYWDGTLVRSYPTYDNGAPEGLILNIGSSSVQSYPAVMQVDYVRVWQH